MIWAAIGPGYKSDLILIDGHVNSQSYVKLLLDNDAFVKMAADYDGNYVFQQDNASSHVSAYALAWFGAMSIPTLVPKWPAKGPDLSPVERVWNLGEDGAGLSAGMPPQAVDAAIGLVDSITIEEINKFV
jgi:hypothetical protein